jgi:phage FluMu protein Com
MQIRFSLVWEQYLCWGLDEHCVQVPKENRRGKNKVVADSGMRVHTNLKCPHCSAIHDYEIDLSISTQTVSCQNCGKPITLGVEKHVAKSTGPWPVVLDETLRQAGELSPSGKGQVGGRKAHKKAGVAILLLLVVGAVAAYLIYQQLPFDLQLQFALVLIMCFVACSLCAGPCDAYLRQRQARRL